jgi:hypothetical protein
VLVELVNRCAANQPSSPQAKTVLPTWGAKTHTVASTGLVRFAAQMDLESRTLLARIGRLPYAKYRAKFYAK